jgi:hypothetical protein
VKVTEDQPIAVDESIGRGVNGHRGVLVFVLIGILGAPVRTINACEGGLAIVRSGAREMENVAWFCTPFSRAAVVAGPSGRGRCAPTPVDCGTGRCGWTAVTRGGLGVAAWCGEARREN